LDRRNFIKSTALTLGGFSLSNLMSCSKTKLPFKISLAQWSLHRTLYSGDLDHLDFPAIAKNTFNLDAVEYVNSFFFDKAKDKAFLREMRTRASDLGVKSLLIMCDNEGNLGDPDDLKRKTAIDNHHKWVEAAKFLGCHSIRVNARSEGSYQDQVNLASEGLRKLTEFGEELGISIIVENHGGLSSNGEWLSTVMRKVDHPMCGTLPDFGNFKVTDDQWYDRYLGVKELMPYAKAVSAKSHEFDSKGNEIHTDYFKMMDIVIESNYSGYVGIEYEGQSVNEMEGIMLTKSLLEKIQDLKIQD
tara:strand:- start:3455 stop:4360 length:906 start_codon:yes stop_codon:yes gene_type:complete